MNALELADWIANGAPFGKYETAKQAVVMLRQQQAEIEKLKAEVVSYRTDAEKLTMRLIDIAVSAPVKEPTDEEWKLLEKVINDCADTIEYRIDVERLAFKGYEHCSELESLYEEQKDASRAKAILRKAQEK